MQPTSWTIKKSRHINQQQIRDFSMPDFTDIKTCYMYHKHYFFLELHKNELGLDHHVDSMHTVTLT